jgi:metal-responsive CopG/Arc/MetJ family transcriptional regulator
MNGLARETRLQIMLDDEELSAIDDWRFKQRMPSRAAAIRQLLRLGLQVEAGEADNRPLRSRSFGVLRKVDGDGSEA